MRGSTINKPGRKSSANTIKRSKRAKNTNELMQEVNGEIDRAIQQAAREAALRHIRDGRNVPVWENDKVVWKPAAVALAEADAAAAPKKVKRRRRPLAAAKANAISPRIDTDEPSAASGVPPPQTGVTRHY
ncbi:MAG TPA: hypothetical protein VFE47_09630 [Tepidisphaeraceae bacterium]|jgi:hypothetical protein|nr:hypothetical protein [Tepidisphaeraceae bacterium]